MKRQTKAAETYEALTRLVEAGMRLSDAIRQLAAETGRNEEAIRASYYQQRKKLGVHSNREHGLTRPLSAEDAISQAKGLLEQALAGIEAELASAKTDLDTAQAHYDALQASAATRRTELERKIAAL